MLGFVNSDVSDPGGGNSAETDDREGSRHLRPISVQAGLSHYIETMPDGTTLASYKDLSAPLRSPVRLRTARNGGMGAGRPGGA